MSWTGPTARLDSLYVAGHSNGGQGTWYCLTHCGDRIKAAAPVSGYSSIQNYVPYKFWHEADPMVTSVIQKALSTYRHEILLENAKGIPVLVQHGSDDDNVPVYHARRMYQLLSQIDSSAVRYVELEGKNHWYDGVMSTPALIEFYRNISAQDARRPRLPTMFSLVVPCTGIMEHSRGGLFVEQLASPDNRGRVDVVRRVDSGHWQITTSNVRRIRLSVDSLRGFGAIMLLIDGTKFDLGGLQQADVHWIERQRGQWWSVSTQVKDSREHATAYASVCRPIPIGSRHWKGTELSLVASRPYSEVEVS